MLDYMGFGRRHSKGQGLKYIALRAISESPRNGVEIMDYIEKMSWGWWRPSPGSIYPMLESLLADHLAIKGDDGKYAITESGSRELGEAQWGPYRAPRTLGEMISEMDGYLSYIEESGEKAISENREQLTHVMERLEKMLRR